MVFRGYWKKISRWWRISRCQEEYLLEKIQKLAIIPRVINLFQNSVYNITIFEIKLKDQYN